MKKLLLALSLVLVIGTNLEAQEIDSRLQLKYKKSEIKKMMTENPTEYQFELNALDRGMFISEIPTEKGKDIVFDGEIKLNLDKEHTYLSLGKEIIDRYQYFKIKGTNKMVVIQPRIFLDPTILNKAK
jgi:hypothetical protein